MVFFKYYNLEILKFKLKFFIMLKSLIQIHILGKSIKTDCVTLLVCY